MDNQPEQPLTSEQSLELITSMISRAKNDYYDTGISALLWGSIVIFCSLATYANQHLKWAALDYIWFLTIVAVVPQVIILIREARQRRYKSRESDLKAGIWVSYAIAIFLFSYLDYALQIRQDAPIYLTLYGIPTFASGYGRRYTPMIIGGLACWVFAVLAVFIPYPNALFLMATGALLAWFIPGLLLRRRYLKAKRQHV
jgi:Flp pilus assembly protein TadB